MTATLKIWIVLLALALMALLAFAGALSAAALVAGLLVTYVMVKYPFLGVLLIAASIPLEDAVVLDAGVRAIRLLGMAVAFGWFVGKVLRREPFQPLLVSRFTWAVSFFIAFVLASAMWAGDTAEVQEGVFQLVMLFAFSLIFIDMARSWQHIDWIVRVIVLSAGVAAGLTVLQYSLGDVRRAGDAIAGVNGTAELLVTLMPLAFYLMAFDERWGWRAVGAGYIAAAVAGVSVTFSRMSFLLLPVVIAALTWELFRARRGRAWIVTMAGTVGIVAVTLVPLDEVVERAASIVPYLEQTVGSATAIDPTVSTRGYHLKVGMAIFYDHPMLGVGYNNFGRHFTNVYQHIVPGAPKVYYSLRSPHSSHIGMLAELGILGAAFWLALLLVAAAALFRARRETERGGTFRRVMFIRLVTYSFLLQVVPYAFYGPNQKSKIFWVLLGLAIAVERLATRGEQIEQPTTDNRLPSFEFSPTPELRRATPVESFKVGS